MHVLKRIAVIKHLQLAATQLIIMLHSIQNCCMINSMKFYTKFNERCIKNIRLSLYAWSSPPQMAVDEKRRFCKQN